MLIPNVTCMVHFNVNLNVLYQLKAVKEQRRITCWNVFVLAEQFHSTADAHQTSLQVYCGVMKHSSDPVRDPSAPCCFRVPGQCFVAYRELH